MAIGIYRQREMVRAPDGLAAPNLACDPFELLALLGGGIAGCFHLAAFQIDRADRPRARHDRKGLRQHQRHVEPQNLVHEGRRSVLIHVLTKAEDHAPPGSIIALYSRRENAVDTALEHNLIGIDRVPEGSSD